VIMLCALLVFIWNHRTALWRLMSLSCASPEAQKVQVLFLLFCLPMISVLFIGVDIDRWSTRYLLVSWQAGSVILAWFLDWLCQKKLALLSALVLLVWATQTLAVGYAYLHQAWRTKYHEPAAITMLEDFFRENSLRGGYADYWLTYTLDFLTEERLTIAPYNGIDRFPQYTELVESLPVQAYLLPAGAVSQENSTIDDLIGFLKLDVLAGDASPGILDPLAHQSVLKRQAIVWWDVWIVSHR
jgi:hypothetical protein